jgi:NAD(P)-dependent dehydrogenase (short-subunit alcohol dehydrogenase family)
MRMLAREAALDLGLYGVQVLGIEAGALAGDEQRFGSGGPGLYQAMDRKIPGGRAGSWEDIAETAAFLLSDGCRHMNGEFVRMDGAFDLFYLQARDADDDRVEGVTLHGV